MAWWFWFLVGGAIGGAQIIFDWFRHPLQAMAAFQNGHPYQFLLFGVVSGSLLFGTPLWLILGLLFRL